jgi:CheY-like chemotaxis protein
MILLVEDEWLIREETADELRHEGWGVLEAGTGECAIAYLQAGRQIDLVITDIQLPGDASGWEVADASRGSRPDMPVIYTSGNACDVARQVPGSIFLDKPYRTSELLSACERLTHAVAA